MGTRTFEQDLQDFHEYITRRGRPAPPPTSKRPAVDSWRRDTDWRGEFRKKEQLLSETFEEVDPLDFFHEVFPPETLSTYQLRDSDTNTGRPCGILKHCLYISPDGKPKLKKELLYDDYRAVELTQHNRFSLLGLCTYFGVQGKSNARPSACHGLAIDLDAVRLQELTHLLGMLFEKLLPVPTYIVNSGHGLHLYYVFEQPVPLQYAETVAVLDKVKHELVNMLWTDRTSADPNRQYQGIFQDMRVPGSWTKFGMKNKDRCRYVLRAYRTGEPVDLTYLTREIGSYFPGLTEDWASISTRTRIPMEEAKKLYPTWYKNIVVKGQEKGYYKQSPGLYQWWLDIITQDTSREIRTSREGNRWNCLVILFVMAMKCGIPGEKALLDANDLIPFFNEKPHSPENEFTYHDVLSAFEYYKKKYVKWSNETIRNRCSIELPPPSIRRNGRSQEAHLERARQLRKLSSYEGVGRPANCTLETEVLAWRAEHPTGTKADCVRDTGLSKPTVYKWWGDEQRVKIYDEEKKGRRLKQPRKRARRRKKRTRKTTKKE